MAAGDILKEEGLVVENFTIKASEDIELGELCYDDGNGLLAVTAAAAAGSKVVMALEDRVYATDTTNGHLHTVPCVVRGFVIAQKVSGSGAASKLNKIMVSGTSGEVTKFVQADAPAGGATQYYQSTQEAALQTNLDLNLGVIGYATKASLDADVVQEMFLGA
jgi:hypothetical protein